MPVRKPFTALLSFSATLTLLLHLTPTDSYGYLALSLSTCIYRVRIRSPRVRPLFICSLKKYLIRRVIEKQGTITLKGYSLSNFLMVIDLTGEDDPPVTASIYIDLTLEDTPSLGVHGNTNSVEALTDSLFEVEQNRPGDENAVNATSSVGRSTGMELEIDFDIASIAWRLNKRPGLLPGTLAYRTDAEVKALGFFAKYYELPLTGREPTRKEGARTVFYEARPMCFDAIFLSSSQSQSVELLTWLTEEGLCTSDDLKRKWGQREETLIYTMAKMRKLKIVKWLVSRIGDASFGETNNDGKCPIFRLTLGTNRYNIDFEVIKFIVLNSKPSSEYVDGVSSSDGRSNLTDWASNFRVCFEMMYIPALRILRRWAVLCLEQKITGQGSGNRKKMLGWVVQMSQSVEARRKERGWLMGYVSLRGRGSGCGCFGDLAPDEEDTEADFTAVSSENDAEEEEDEYSATRLREEREGREEETDPLLKVFLPPMGHIWVYKKGHYDCM